VNDQFDHIKLLVFLGKGSNLIVKSLGYKEYNLVLENNVCVCAQSWWKKKCQGSLQEHVPIPRNEHAFLML
jgi:hypothetical protein